MVEIINVITIWLLVVVARRGCLGWALDQLMGKALGNRQSHNHNNHAAVPFRNAPGTRFRDTIVDLLNIGLN